MKKKPAQLQREIDAALAKRSFGKSPLDRAVDAHPGVRSLIVKNIDAAGTLPESGDRVATSSGSMGTVISVDDPRETKYPGVWVVWDELVARGDKEAQWWTGKLAIVGRATAEQRKAALLPRRDR